MKKKTIKMLSVLFAASAASAGLAYADGMSSLCGGPVEPCPEGPAMFAAKGEETRRITIGGNLQVGYQYIDVNDEYHCKKLGPEEYNNFKIHHARLSVTADLCEGWSGHMNIDFAGKCGATFERDQTSEGPEDLKSSCACKDMKAIAIDKAYIQKTWLDATFRIGYQKVNFGAEENTPEPHLKTIERSVATNFFTNLGRRAVSLADPIAKGPALDAEPCTAKAPTNMKWVGQRLGGRHMGVFGAGQIGAFHYSAAVTNAYQGVCCNSDDLNNSLNFYASLAFEFGVDCIDFLAGVNAAYSDKGSNASSTKNHNVYAFNPYVFANYDRFSIMAEMFWGSVEDGKITKEKGDSDPWGFNVIPSFMLNDNWELVGRFSYVNSDEMGMTIHNAFGCAPDSAFANKTLISSQNIFEKVYAGYLGINYYMLNGAMKASLGLEQAKFKNRFSGDVKGATPGTFAGPYNKGAKVNAVRAALQFLF